MSQTDLAAFQQKVIQDSALQATLRELADEAAFITAVCAAAQSHGFDVKGEDVLQELQAARRGWIERWIT